MLFKACKEIYIRGYICMSEKFNPITRKTIAFLLKGLLDSCTESLCQVEALQHNNLEIILQCLPLLLTKNRRIHLN